jgi:hypothetical protein
LTAKERRSLAAAGPVGRVRCVSRAVPGGNGGVGAERAGKQDRLNRIIVYILGRDDLVWCRVVLDPSFKSVDQVMGQISPKDQLAEAIRARPFKAMLHAERI